ncbi:hypothetical protein ACI797_17790 [Geodermatophilus sp. SYSU D00691]
MNTNTLNYFDFGQLPGGQLSPEQTSELAHMRCFSRTWTTHEPWSDNAVVIAGRIARLAEGGALSAARPGMVLTAALEESDGLTARLREFLPELAIRNLTGDDRLSPGRSKASRAAVAEEAAVRVISCRMFREARQSFWKAGGPVVFLDQAERLRHGGQNYGFVRQLTHAAESVHVFTTVDFLEDPVATFHLGSLLGLPGFPPTLQRFKTAYVHSTGYGINEAIAWRESARAEVTDLLDFHYYERFAQDG